MRPSVLAAGVYLGQLEGRRRVRELTLCRSVYAPATRLAEHAHATDYLCLGLRGRFLECSGGVEELVQPGMAVLHPHGELHADILGPEAASCLSISLARGWIGESQRSLRADGRPRYAPAAAVTSRSRGARARPGFLHELPRDLRKGFAP